jgi:hypothetical protein
MPAILGLLQAPDPRRTGSRQQARPQQQDGLEQLLGIVESATDNPLGQEIVRGILSDRLGIRIPTREQKMLQDAQLQQASQELQRKGKDDLTRQTLGFLVDKAQEDAAVAIPEFASRIGINLSPEIAQSLSGQTVEQAINNNAQTAGGAAIGPLDQTLIRNLTRASDILAMMMTADLPRETKEQKAVIDGFREEFRIGFGNLLDFDITKGQAVKTETDLARDELSAEAGATREREVVAKGISSFRKDFIDPIMDSVESDLDLDLSPSVFGRGDVDEAAGAQGLQVALRLIRKTNPSMSNEAFLNHALPLLEDLEVGDILREESEFDQKSPTDVVIMPKTKTSAVYLKMLRGLAADTGTDEASIYARLGLAATRSERAANEAVASEP